MVPASQDLPLAEWRDFYVMIGTASGVIVGAAFVVATLAAGLEHRTLGLRGFISPTTVHLGSVLVGSAVLMVPTLTRPWLMVLLGSGGIAGVVYSVIVAMRIWQLNLDISDRASYAIVPVLIYAAMAFAAFLARWRIGISLEILAAALVALLVIGMRNAWDMASFMISRERDR